MLRLILLTIVGLFGVLALYGTPEMAGGSTVEAQDTIAQTPVKRASFLTLASAQAAMPSPGIPPAKLIAAAMAGATSTEVIFEGPRLKPSPEHAGMTPALPAATASSAGRLYVTGSSVSLRAKPSAEGRRIASLDRGTAVEAVGKTDGAWIEVVSAGTQGFVSARFLSNRVPN